MTDQEIREQVLCSCHREGYPGDPYERIAALERENAGINQTLDGMVRIKDELAQENAELRKDFEYWHGVAQGLGIKAFDLESERNAALQRVKELEAVLKDAKESLNPFACEVVGYPESVVSVCIAIHVSHLRQALHMNERIDAALSGQAKQYCICAELPTPNKDGVCSVCKGSLIGRVTTETVIHRTKAKQERAE